MAADKKDIPTHLPPFYSFFTDDAGRLFVRTWEKGENPGEYIHDIFNTNGIYIGSKSMIAFTKTRDQVNSYVKIKNDRLFGVRIKESGYKELVVYKMIWE